MAKKNGIYNIKPTRGGKFETDEWHDYNERTYSVFYVEITMYSNNSDKNTMSDEKFSNQPAVGLSTKIDRLAWRPAVDDDFWPGMDYEVSVQAKHSVRRTMEIPESYSYCTKHLLL